MFTYNTETLSGITYYTTTNKRGTTTTIFEMVGTVFVMVNRSPAKALEDIKKQSKQVQNLLAVFEADKAEKAAKEETTTEEKAAEIHGKIEAIKADKESKEGANGFLYL